MTCFLADCNMPHEVVVDLITETRLVANRQSCRSGVISTAGEMMSRFQYRLLADTSPGSVKFGKVASAMLCARPMPGLQHAAAPHRNSRCFTDVVQTPRFRESAHPPQFDVDYPARLSSGSPAPRDAPTGCTHRGRSASRAAACSAAWSMMSSCASGCSIIIR